MTQRAADADRRLRLTPTDRFLVSRNDVDITNYNKNESYASDVVMMSRVTVCAWCGTETKCRPAVSRVGPTHGARDGEGLHIEPTLIELARQPGNYK